MKKFKKESMIYGAPVKHTKTKDMNNAGTFESVQNSTSLMINRNLKKGFSDKIIISPSNNLVRYFHYLIILSAFWSTVSSAYYACFGIPDFRVLNITDIVMEVLFSIELIMTFFQEYQDEETNKPVRDLKKIAKRYLTGIFIFDAVALSTTPIFYAMQVEGESDM